MDGCFSFFRSLLSVLFLGIITILVFIGIPALSFSKLVTNPETIKNWLDESGVYTEAVPIALETVAEQNDMGGDMSDLYNTLNSSSSNERAFIDKTLTPEFLKQSTETIIDAGYMWFRGVTSTPEFEIPITQDKESLIDMVALGSAAQLESLPVCSPGYEPPDPINPFEATCLPPEYSKADIEVFLRENANEEELQTLMNNATFNSSTLNITQNTTELVQKIYTILEYLPLAIVGLYVLLTIFVIALMPRVQLALVGIGLATFTPSAILCIPSLYLDKIQDYRHSLIFSGTTNTSEHLNAIIDTLTKTIVNDAFAECTWMCYIAIAIGAVFFITGIVLSIRWKKPTPEAQAINAAQDQYGVSNPIPSNPDPVPVQ